MAIREHAAGILAVALGLAAAATTIGAADTDAVTARLAARVRTLTAAELAGRAAGSPESAAVAETLAAWLDAAGLEPAFASGWQQAFPLRGEDGNGGDLSGRPARNVAGTVRGRGELAERWIVVGAHHDHLGRTESADTTGVPAPDGYYPGANDNASGVAIVQELARLAAADAGGDTVPRRSVLFVYFDGEEVGLQGSGHFVGAPPVPLDTIDAMLNLDTVGRLLDGRLFVSGIGTSPHLPGLVAAANTDRLTLSLAQGGWSGSDHMVFNTREIPVLFLFGGPYPEYNRPADDGSNLDHAAMGRVTAFAARLLDGLRREPGERTWVMVADGGLRDGNGGKAGTDADQNRRTWLGTLPDFSEEIAGYPLAGVFDDSPAARAGLQKGDVLVRLARDPVTDLATFTRALRSHGPGDVVEIEIRRAGKPLNFTVVLGDRADRN